ncbi:MAG TPA: asparaginase domain-containing protein [Thermoanaerobaculia bacterium]|nr:asparaginase domain-containing protein [Thermoanaerobaculia bacterium]
MSTADWHRRLDLPNGSQIGDFIVERFVGQGGTAAVFVGRSATSNDGMRVALKVLNPTMLDLDDERVRLERQLRLRDHSCPYLVRPITWFDTDVNYLDNATEPTLVAVSEYIEGKPLNPKTLPERRIRPIVAMITKAAHFLEVCGFCHRDIKPDNIIVSPDMTRITLLDLGVLHAYQQVEGEPPLTGTRTNHALVTPRYSSPEILSGQLGPNSPPEDWLAHTIYQIGAIIFEAITESTIFAGMEREALVIAITQLDPFARTPVTRCFDLENITKECLAKKARDRCPLPLEALEFRRQARKPTIVLLYCGGTIGASSDPRGHSLQPRKLDQESPLTVKITDRLRQDYKELAPGLPLPALEWRFVEDDFQIFSENANPDVWNGITAAVSRIFLEDWSGKYLAGVILLHGTDTLAYTAAALQLAFPRITCPIIITGSNQPPSDEENVETSWHTSQSDAWVNLLRSVLFIVDGGHRLPMVYATFANTICHAVNLQKTPLNRIPIRIASAFRFLNEAFSYRNVELGRRFAYKYVEGVLINNFLPVLGLTSFYGAPPGGRAPWERASIDVEKVNPVAAFSRDVDAMTVLPCDTNGVSRDDNFHLLVAYPSGTISDAVREKIGGWNAIVTQWGLSPRQAEYAAPTGLPSTQSRLYRLIPETALPLLSLAASSSRNKVETGIATIVASNPIINSLIGNPLHRENQRNRIEYIQRRAVELHKQTIESTLFRTEKNDELPTVSSDSTNLQAGPSLIYFRRHHWAALMYGVVAPHAHAGSLAEQFAALFDIGFDTGVSVAVEWDRLRSSVKEEGTIENAIRTVCVSILASGLAKARAEIIQDDRTIRLRLTTKSYANQEAIYAESWAFDSTSDHRFLDQIEHGIPLEIPDQDGDYFVGQLERLHSTNEKIRTSPVYWYILGIVKGALCWFLSDRGRDPIYSANSIRPTVILRLLVRQKGSGNDEARFVFSRSLLVHAMERESPNSE